MSQGILLRLRVAAAILAQTLLIATAALANDASSNPDARPSFWERPELLRIEGGPRDVLGRYGLGLKLWLTQFYQGDVVGDGNHDGEYGGRGDVFLTMDSSKLGLWSGFSLTVHGEGVFGDDANFSGDGSVLPVNTVTYQGPRGTDPMNQKEMDNLSTLSALNARHF